jgi:hypothetical protein
MVADADRWGVSGGAALAPADVRLSAAASAGCARAVDEPKVADADRWGVSGGAALAPPDFN